MTKKKPKPLREPLGKVEAEAINVLQWTCPECSLTHEVQNHAKAKGSIVRCNDSGRYAGCGRYFKITEIT